MILIKQAEVYMPEYIGEQDVLLAGEKIVWIDKSIDIDSENIKLIDGKGKKLIPGIIDNHVHITGGGGEGSFKTRVPELPLSSLLKGGITTVVGLMGTDGITRSVENLLSRVKTLREEGISAYMHTGSYGFPSVTLTGSVQKDIVFIEEIIGVKIALADHRSSFVTKEELARLASQARVAGMVSGKAGIVVAHMGDGKNGLDIVRQVLKETDLPLRTIRPTHVNRNPDLMEEAFRFAEDGGYIDMTCGMDEEYPPAVMIPEAIKRGIAQDKITISSDGGGSYSEYDEDGNMLKIGVLGVDSMLKEFQQMVQEMDMEISDALKYVTSNVANALNLYPQKGAIKVGSDGDVVLLNQDLSIDSVIAKGKLMIEDGRIIVKGTYEDTVN
ncbi:beta-aspartyl-peptidase [Desemzia sp. RIT804]|uniref:beta-aspartyl-peptidase n=1 Tax=Desemzia sp. RIT 804 TaxID=2810209 RepID=UPI00195212D3|nr:beta-aspartyl-peptidase [Desemzia sp. RIT 804]